MNRELTTSVKILKELHNGLEEITSAGKQSYQYYARMIHPWFIKRS